jgi:hypothetical protein
MPFMVIYKRTDGSSGFEQADAIDEAAMFVERLRNKDGIQDDIRIYRMEEISFAFRPYYKVELGMPELQTAAPPAEEEAPIGVFEAPAVEPPAAGDPASEIGPEMDDAAAAGRRGLFGR